MLEPLAGIIADTRELVPAAPSRKRRQQAKRKAKPPASKPHQNGSSTRAKLESRVLDVASDWVRSKAIQTAIPDASVNSLYATISTLVKRKKLGTRGAPGSFEYKRKS